MRELRDVQHVKISQIMSHTSVGAKWVWICAIQGGCCAPTRVKLMAWKDDRGGRGSVAKQDDLRAGRNTGRILVRKCNEMKKCWKMKIATSSETEASTSGLQCRALSLWIMRAFSSQRGRFCWSVLCNNWESPVVIFCVRVCVCVERISGLSIHVYAYTEILVFFGKVVIIFKAWKWKSEHFEHNSWSF